MARQKKSIEVDMEDAPVQKPKKKRRYYAKYLGFSFDYPVVDEKGNQLFRMNPETGREMYDSMGNKIPITRNEKFRVLEQRFSKGYVSFTDFDESDDSAQNLARGIELENLANARGVKVYNEDEYDKITNFEKFLEKQRAKDLEGQLDQERAEKTALARRTEDLERRLKEIEGNG